jgi:hypothetical protein
MRAGSPGRGVWHGGPRIPYTWRMVAWRGGVWFVCLLGAGCSPFDLPPVAAETEHFRYRTTEGLEVCEAALEWLELHHRAVSAWMGVALRSGRKLDYTYVGSFSDMMGFCGYAGGCAGDGMAFAYEPYNAHEATHLVADRLGTPPALFREGLAEVLGCNPMAPPMQVHASTDLLSLMEDADFRAYESPHRAYRWAAGFTRFLIDRHGKQPFLRFYADLSTGAAFPRIASDFLQHFGEDLGGSVRAWVEAPPQTYRDVCLHVTECAAPPASDPPGATETFACGLGSASAPRALVRTLDLEEPAGVRLRLDTEASTRVDIFPCGPSTMAPLEHSQRPGGTTELWARLPAGRHWVRITDTDPEPEPGGPIPLTLAATRSPSVLQPDLAGADTQHIPTETANVLLRGHFNDATGGTGSSRLGFAFDVEAQRTLGFRGFLQSEMGASGSGAFDGEYVALCEGDMDALSCETTHVDTGWRWFHGDDAFTDRLLEPSERYVLLIDGSPTPAGMMLELRLDPEG